MWKDYEVSPHGLSVVIGRFQPLHKGHEALLDQAIRHGEKTLILVGSSGIARSSKNPFTFEERKAMILTYVFAKGHQELYKSGKLAIEPLVDELYSDARWIASVQSLADKHAIVYADGSKGPINIVGHYKDDSSYYLHLFPSWKLVKAQKTEVPHDGTAIRTKLYEGTFSGLQYATKMVSDEVAVLLEDFIKSPVGKDMAEEHEYLKNYKKRFEVLPYPPVFVTVDSVVLMLGHILLVKRKAAPGKGLWALPGGFINKNETVRQSMLRELYEETKIAVPQTIMESSLERTHVFDAPGRSLRGRVITHAGLFLPGIPDNGQNGSAPSLPYVKGSDDAEKAKWVPLAEFYQMSDQLFEDHYDIARFMINRA